MSCPPTQPGRSHATAIRSRMVASHSGSVPSLSVTCVTIVIMMFPSLRAPSGGGARRRVGSCHRSAADGNRSTSAHWWRSERGRGQLALLQALGQEVLLRTPRDVANSLDLPVVPSRTPRRLRARRRSVRALSLLGHSPLPQSSAQALIHV